MTFEEMIAKEDRNAEYARDIMSGHISPYDSCDEDYSFTSNNAYDYAYSQHGAYAYEKHSIRGFRIA